MASEKARVQIYGSSVSGNRKIKDAQRRTEDVLQSYKIPFEFVDIAADEQAKLYMRRKNGGNNELPQIFVDGEFRGSYTAFEEAIEFDEVEQFLALDKPKVDEIEALIAQGVPSEAELLELLEEDEKKHGSSSTKTPQADVSEPTKEQ